MMEKSRSAAPAVNYGDLFYRYPAGAAKEERSEAKPQTTAAVQAPALDLDEAERFLSRIWECYHPDALCYALVVMDGRGLRFKHFCTDRAECQKPERCARRWLERQRGLGSAHVYFQVLPLARKPERGRGSEKDVLAGQWVFADLDFKSVTEKAEFEGCREGEDHALECYYSEGGKWVHVKRPPLRQVLEGVRARLGAEPSIVVDSGAGYHLYFKLHDPLEAKNLKPLLEKVVMLLGGDPQSKDLARILRLPGTINPRVNRRVKVILETQSVLTYEDIKRIVWEPEAEKREERGERVLVQARGLLELDNMMILKIAELFRVAYKPGCRQNLVMCLSGALAKAGVSPLSAVKITKMLYESTQDSDPLKTRLAAVVYTYKKAGVELDPYAEAIEEIAGVKPYGLESEIREEEVKGISGLQEILEKVVGEEKALEIIHEFTELLQRLTPYNDAVVEVIEDGRPFFAVANPRRKMIFRAVKTERGLVYKERVAVVCPVKVVLYDNPIGGIRKYEVTFEGQTLFRPLTIGPALVEEIAERLRAEGLVYHSRLIVDTLAAILNAYVRKGKAEVRSELEAPGFYLIEGKPVAVKYDYDFNTQRLREALELLSELAEVWFKRTQEKFAVVVKWGAVAPFSFMMKEKGRWVPWLFLYGDSATGKTTLGRIVLKMWGLGTQQEKTGASIDTVARLGYVLSMSTFPVLINEPGAAITKEDVIEVMKNAVENKVVRGKFLRGTYVEYPALAPLIFTSNRLLPRDDGLLRRMKVITFTYGEKIPLEKQKEFKERVEPRLAALAEVGKFITYVVFKAPQVLDKDPFLAGEVLLRSAYEYVGLKPPEWLNLKYEEVEEYGETIAEEFIERFKKLINDLFARYMQRIHVDTETSIQQRIIALLKAGLIPGVTYRNEEKVIIKRALLEELGLDVSLKSLAEILDMEYTRKYAERVDGRLQGGAAIITTLEKLLNLFS